MKLNKVLIKICLDVELAYLDLQNYEVPGSTKVVKMATKLHKSIKKNDNTQDFTLSLNMFPNKLRFESINDRIEFLGERKIISLVKEKVIHEISSPIYKSLKKMVKKANKKRQRKTSDKNPVPQKRQKLHE